MEMSMWLEYNQTLSKLTHSVWFWGDYMKGEAE